MKRKNRHEKPVEKLREKRELRKQRRDNAEFYSAYGDVLQAVLIIMIIPRLMGILIVPLSSPMYYLVMALLLLGMYNQVKIYRPMIMKIFGRKFEDRLITTGWFRITRHPMYTFLLLADAVILVHRELDTTNIIYTIVLYAMTIVTSYFHEQHVLARFGEPAREYYRKTPRLFFLYPFTAFWAWRQTRLTLRE